VITRLTVVALALLMAAGTAHGFELLRVNNDPCARSDHDLFWKPASVPVSIDPLPDIFRPLAVEAWQTWNMSIGSFRFTGGNGPACVRDGVAAMQVAPTACGQGAFEGALAVTRSIWREDTGQLIDADITFQSDTVVTGNADLFRQVAMHELGHVLGLAHSDACGGNSAGTLMKAFLNFNDPILTAPQADDVSGANAIYGGGGSGGGVADGTNSCAVVPGGANEAGLLWLLPVALLLIGRRLCHRN